MLCIVGCTHVHRVVQYKVIQNIPYLVAIVDCFQVANYSLLQGPGNTAQENMTNLTADVLVAQEDMTNLTADVLVEDQLWCPFDLVAVDQERELHKPNS